MRTMHVSFILPIYFKKSQVVVLFEKDIKIPAQRLLEGSVITLGMFRSRTYTIRKVTQTGSFTVVSLKNRATDCSDLVLEMIQNGWSKKLTVDIGATTNIPALSMQLKNINKTRGS